MEKGNFDSGKGFMRLVRAALVAARQLLVSRRLELI